MAADDPVPRGSWTLDEAVLTRWRTANLGAAVREEWPTDDKDSQYYSTLHDRIAEPEPPGPYVVYQKSTPIIRGHMTGSTGVSRFNQFQQITFQLRIHARDRQPSGTTPGSSAKDICVAIAKKIVAGFDPETMPWTIYDDAIVSVTRGPDLDVAEGEDECAWFLQYDVLLDAEYKV